MIVVEVYIYILLLAGKASQLKRKRDSQDGGCGGSGGHDGTWTYVEALPTDRQTDRPKFIFIER